MVGFRLFVIVCSLKRPFSVSDSTVVACSHLWFIISIKLHPSLVVSISKEFVGGLLVIDLIYLFFQILIDVEWYSALLCGIPLILAHISNSLLVTTDNLLAYPGPLLGFDQIFNCCL